MKKLSKIDEGLVVKMLDLYLKYCELKLPFRLGDAYELFEFDLNYLGSTKENPYDTYEYVKDLHLSIGHLKVHSAVLVFHWDRLIDIELESIISRELYSFREYDDQQNVVVIPEKLFIVETKECVVLTYVLGLEEIELIVVK